nr:YetF domain-containing protein [uncultured Ruminococcus sp.]
MLTLLIRTILIYIIVTAAVRLMGKRQVSDMQTSELVITLIISEVASLPLENAERPLLNSLVPIMVIVAIELLVSLLMMKSKRFRSLICGHPIIIIKDGQMIDSQLRKLRISREDVYSLLREKDIADESTVRWGIIEPNGTLSVLTDDTLTENGLQSEDLQEQVEEAKKEETE